MTTKGQHTYYLGEGWVYEKTPPDQIEIPIYWINWSISLALIYFGYVWTGVCVLFVGGRFEAWIMRKTSTPPSHDNL